MIPYEDLCRSLDIYNRKLRGEDVPEEAYQEQVADDDFDIIESAEADEQAFATQMEGEDAEGLPDVTAETAMPEADFGGYEQAQQQEGYEQAQQQEGYEQAQQQPGAPPDDQEPNREQ
jgi:hypothetical protein